jgi:hypothetical protein
LSNSDVCFIKNGIEFDGLIFSFENEFLYFSFSFLEKFNIIDINGPSIIKNSLKSTNVINSLKK